jgi:hypothetical protein
MIAATVVSSLALVGAAQADNYGGTSTTSQTNIVRMIYAKFGTGYIGRTMVCIARRESGLNPRAANWRDANGGSHGLFQINGIHRGWVDFKRIYDPAYNIQVAYRLSKNGRSLGPWNGHC